MLGDNILPPTPRAPLQSVLLDFGQIGVAVNETDPQIFREDGDAPLTLDLGPREGFDPQTLGYAPVVDRDMLIEEIIAQVEEDFQTTDGQDMEVVFGTVTPEFAPFSTVRVFAGNYPDMVLQTSVPATQIRLEVATARLAFSGGLTNNYYMRLADGQLRRPDDSLVGEVFPELQKIRIDAFGIAQELDKGNLDKGKRAWVFVDEHTTSGTPEENLRELANSISHELGHLVGLEHNDGIEDSILGRLNTYGIDKNMSLAARDKAVEVLPPCEGFSALASGMTARRGKVGDTDQYGTSEPVAVGGVDPDADAIILLREARVFLENHITHEAQFEHKLVDVFQSGTDDPSTDIPLPTGTSPTFSVDTGSTGVTGAFAAGRIDIEIMNVADVLGGADDLKLFVEGIEFEGAFDGLDQRLTAPEFAGYAIGQRVSFDLEEYLTIPQIETILADDIVDVTLEVEGDTPFVVVDSVVVIITDKGPDAIRGCGNGTINLAAGRRADVLFVNGTAGAELRTVAVGAGDSIWGALLLPPAGGVGKFVLHMNSGLPTDADVIELPASIGTSCFPMLLPTAMPLSVWNNIGKTHLVGASNYFSSPISNPGKAPEIFLFQAAGDPTNLPVGTTVTIQGVIFDPATYSPKGVSATNGVILEVR